MDINRYNTRVRQAISDKYVECTKRKQEIGTQLLILRNKLTSFMDDEITLTYTDYTNLKSSIDELNRELKRLDIERDIWDKAREICLDIADEMDGD